MFKLLSNIKVFYQDNQELFLIFSLVIMYYKGCEVCEV